MKAWSLNYFLSNALDDPALCWKPEALQHIGSLQVPEQIFGDYPALFRGDIHRLWAEWFLGACIDIHRLAAQDVYYATIYKEVRDFFIVTFGCSKNVEELAKTVARIVDKEVARLKRNIKRIAVSMGDRQLMIDLAHGKPRCWVCGYKFSDAAIENFLIGKRLHELPKPLLIDVFKPIGLSIRDMQIEVDHVHPFSRGGEGNENLRIACGWCNRHKSSHSTLYDSAGVDRRGNGRSGYLSLPQPFWVIRLLVLNGASVNSGKTARDSELTVTLRRSSGKATPPNLQVVSYDDGVPKGQLLTFDSAYNLIKSD